MNKSLVVLQYLNVMLSGAWAVGVNVATVFRSAECSVYVSFLLRLSGCSRTTLKVRNVFPAAA